MDSTHTHRLTLSTFGVCMVYGYLMEASNILGWVLFGAFAVFILYFLNKRFKASNDFLAVFSAFMLFFAFFMFPTRIHERYLFPAISVLALMFPLIKRARPLYVALTATLLINEAYVLYWLNNSYPNAAPNLTGDPIVVAVSAINLLMLVYASILMWRQDAHGSKVNLQRQVNQQMEGSRMNLNLDIKLTKKDIITIVLLSIVFFSIAVANLGLTQSPTTTAQLTDGQSFYITLGVQTNVKSVIFLLKQGAMDVNISTGSPGNWASTQSTMLGPILIRNIRRIITSGMK